jgi:hypothetical protein
LLPIPANKIQKSTSRRRCRFIYQALSVQLVVLLFLPVPLLHPQVYSKAVSSQHLVISEYQLKAVYLYNFLHFVTWPEKIDQADGLEPLIIGVVGRSPFGDTLAEIKASLPDAKQKGIAIISFGPYRQGMDLSRCHLLFVSASEQKNFSSILNDLKGKSVLTVADHEKFLAAGGMINLVNYKGKVRWEVNREPVQQAGLRLSAKLLAMAVNIVDKSDKQHISGEKNR